MFDKTMKKLADKMGRSVKTSIEPLKTEVKKTVDHKVDLYSRVLRLCVLVILFIEGTKRIDKYDNEQSTSPNQIIINNYLNEKDGDKK